MQPLAHLSPYNDNHVTHLDYNKLPFLVHCGASQIEAVDGICQMGTDTIKLLLI
jgi:hypothetical protein